ncbi:SDR family oxidoreductase [Paraconexibacter antarcticus]|uniref:SDR family oxidoreductase n=1 Tax=Paraconexibacter antarcticus TaxID=2949664 RepID=A0ABY5DRW8_9ACTN|nr:SDR family oxidoreductase [Paraconexibacter antarcticus]UTI64180.1 SDR family oxidoreductase [Paraconexibacter antarcticus]
MSDLELEGRRAHVTGAASGIGWAIAQRLAAGGARVAISDVDEEGAKARAAELGSGHVGLGCDVRSMSEVSAAIDATVDAFGGLDLLVNNAGVEIGKPMVDTEEDEFMTLMDINVNGVYRASRAATAALAAAAAAGSDSAIVNIASVAGVGGCPLLSAYCASKAAVIRFSEVCAIELREAGVRVNAVCPAFIDTPMVQRLAPAVAAMTGMEFGDVVAVKQGRYGTLEEVAEVVAFLGSSEAAWTTGSHYVLDGGISGGLL